MPEISDSDYRLFIRYQEIGSPEDIRKKQTDLVNDNGKQRDQIRALEGKVPAEGAVVLTGDDAKAWEGVKPLLTAHKPEEIKAGLEELPTLRTSLAERDRKDARRAFAEAVKVPEAALESLKQFDGATFEVKEETIRDAAGKESKVKVGYVTKAGEGAKAARYDDFVKELPGDVQTLLKADTGGRGAAGGNRIEMSPHRIERDRPGGDAPTDQDHVKATTGLVDYSAI